MFSVAIDGTVWEGRVNAFEDQTTGRSAFGLSAERGPEDREDCSAERPCERFSLYMIPAPDGEGTFTVDSADFELNGGASGRSGEYGAGRLNAGDGTLTLRLTEWGDFVEGTFEGTLVNRYDSSDRIQLTEGTFAAPVEVFDYEGEIPNLPLE